MIAAAALLLTGCQADKASSSVDESSGVASSVDQTTSDTSAESTTAAEPDVTPAQPTAEAQNPESSESDDETVFRSGVWRGSNEYFLFYADGTGGVTRDFENGIGVPFEYEYGEESITFHMAASDNNTIAVPSDITEDSVTITWEDGTAEKFVYVSEDEEGFQFYSNEELEPIARRYFQANNPDSKAPELADVQTNDDGYATIQLYDQEGDNINTMAWYMINRVTLTGSDGMTGSAVNMSGFAEEETAEG